MSAITPEPVPYRPSQETPSPPVPRWLRPGVRVRRRGTVVCVEQRVPARVVESAGVSRDGDFPGRGHAPGRGRRVLVYESGLGSGRSTLPMVRERLTVPVGAVGSPDAVRTAVREALAGFAPDRRPGPMGLLPALRCLPHALQAVLCAGLVGALWSVVLRIPEGPTGADTDDVVARAVLAFASVFTVAVGSLVLMLLRRAWIVRTPSRVAEDQWQLLHGTLTRISGAEPGSSRPLDVEGGRRRDLITHPLGERAVGGTTRDGRPGPVWPDGADVARAVRRARRQSAALAVLLSPFLALTVLFLFWSVTAGPSAATAVATVFAAALGVIACLRARATDRRILARPAVVAGEGRPVRLDVEDVDTENLAPWCEARRLEDRWTGLAALCVALGVVAVAVQVAFSAAVDFSPTGIPGTTADTMVAAAPVVTVVVAGFFGLPAYGAWARRRDARRRARAGLV